MAPGITWAFMKPQKFLQPFRYFTFTSRTIKVLVASAALWHSLNSLSINSQIRRRFTFIYAAFKSQQGKVMHKVFAHQLQRYYQR